MIVGGFIFADQEDSKSIGYVAALVVDPLFQGKGVASRMIPLVKKAAKELGYSNICASVFVDNPAAIRLLKEAGLHEGRWFAGNL